MILFTFLYLPQITTLNAKVTEPKPKTYIYTVMGEQCYNSRLPALPKHNLCCGGVVEQTRIQLKAMLHLHFASIMQGDQHLKHIFYITFHDWRYWLEKTM